MKHHQGVNFRVTTINRDKHNLEGDSIRLSGSAQEAGGGARREPNVAPTATVVDVAGALHWFQVLINAHCQSCQVASAARKGDIHS